MDLLSSLAWGGSLIRRVKVLTNVNFPANLPHLLFFKKKKYFLFHIPTSFPFVLSSHLLPFPIYPSPTHSFSVSIQKGMGLSWTWAKHGPLRWGRAKLLPLTLRRSQVIQHGVLVTKNEAKRQGENMLSLLETSLGDQNYKIVTHLQRASPPCW